MKFKLLEDYRKDYLDRTERHIAKVMEYGKKIDKDYQYHDSDKLGYLFDDYSLMMKKDKFGGSESKDDMSGLTPEEEERVNLATLQHITDEEHHPEYGARPHITEFDRANPPMMLDCTCMPNECIDEMLCDGCAMSEEFNNTPYEWMQKTVPSRGVFSDEQQEYMKNRLNQLGEN